MRLDFGARPAGWICRGGAPAAAVGSMPSHATEDEKIVLYESLAVTITAARGFFAMPLSYGTTVVLAPEGLAPLHHSPDAWWRWRPKLHRKRMLAWETLGSQQELAWRHALADLTHLIHAGGGWTMDDANAKAAAILREHLSPQQRLEMAARGAFRVRGARTGNMYVVRPGNGFAIIDHRTGEEVVSYCLHPEGWIPHDDVALATKFALEDGELEVECLENARIGRMTVSRPARADDERAAEMERELIV